MCTSTCEHEHVWKEGQEEAAGGPGFGGWVSTPCFQDQHAVLQFVPVPLESLGELRGEARGHTAFLPICGQGEC